MTSQIAVIGAGAMGALHARNAARLGAEVTVVADIDGQAAKRLADELRSRTAETLNDALDAAPVDAVVIATREATHPQLLMTCIDANVPAFCEKPLGLDLDDAFMVRARAAANDAHVFVGFNRRFDPSRVQAKQAITRGEIGGVEVVRMISCDTAETIDFHFAGGIFFNPFSHDFDAARWLLGDDVTHVTAMASELVPDKHLDAGDVDTAVVSLRTTKGRLASLTYSRRATYGHDQRIEVHGDRGMLQIGNQPTSFLQIVGLDGSYSPMIEPDFRARYAAAYLAEMADFLEGIELGRPPTVSVEDGWQSMLIGEAARRSFQNSVIQTVADCSPETAD